MNHYKRFSLKKLINTLLLSGICVSLIPFNIHSTKALEFQWNPNDGYKRLRYYQRNPEKNFKNKIFLFFTPSDRKTGLMSINIKIPNNFISSLKPKNISLCKANVGGYRSKTECIKDIPSEIVLDKETKRLEIYPISPLPSDKDSYAVVFKINNPRRSGLYQFHSFGQSSGPIPVTSYIGSWTINIDP
tara:strand:+ start:52 stop:615 length:564 start_codon:yes stop_codon:yes gene_type:complete